MSILQALIPKHILLKRRVANKEALLRELSQHAAAVAGVSVENILQALQRREQLGSTGVGTGIAIPHARLADLPQDIGLLMTLDRPIDFASIDGQPVDLVFLLLSAGSNATHLQQLACIARLLRDPDQAKQLRAATDATAVMRLLQAG